MASGTKPLSIPTETAFRLVCVQNGQAWSQPQAQVTVANLQSGAQSSLLYPGRKDVKPDPKVVELLKSLKPGDIVNVKGAEIAGKHVLTSIDQYKPKPGEDEPGVFVFKEKAIEKINGQTCVGVVVAKYFSKATAFVPMVKDAAGKLVPDAAISSEISKFRDGDVVMIQAEPAGQYAILRSIQPYVAPSKGDFVKYTPKKAGDEKSFAAIEVKTGDGSVTLNIPNVKVGATATAPDEALVSAVLKLKAGQAVEYRTRKDSAGEWLSFLRAAPQEAKEATKTDKVAAK